MLEVYWTDAERERWRVYDTSYHAHKNTIHPPGDARATSRIFVPRDGVKRVHAFAKGEPRALTDEHLARQLRGSGYLAHEKFDSSEHTAR